MERQGSRREDGSDEGGEGDVDGEEQGREVEGRDGKVERVKEHTLLWARREVCSLLPPASIHSVVLHKESLSIMLKCVPSTSLLSTL